MMFIYTWRWFGPKDPITLREINQTGVSGIVTALHHIPIGDVWSVDDIVKRKRMIEAEGLSWSAVESLPVHEDIKKKRGGYRRYLDNYKTSLRHLGQCGIDTVCYHFMPLLDWVRTDLEFTFGDGSITTRFETRAFTAFDLFALKRPGAEEDYTGAQIEDAKKYYERLNICQMDRLTHAVLLGLPGSLEAYSLDAFRAALADYREIGNQEYRSHLYAFLTEVIPVAEESGVRMVIHPDDPPRPLLGLPRIVSNMNDIEQILHAVESPSNGLALCTGSLGASIQNDVVKMTERFADRVRFAHLRNVTRNEDGDFFEATPLEGDVDLFGVMRTLLLEQKRRSADGSENHRILMRPDHGHLMKAERRREGLYPGYSFCGRLRNLAELHGMEEGIRRSLNSYLE